MKNHYLTTSLIALIMLITSFSHSQVKIGDNHETIDANSLLELESTDKGVLIPRVTLNDASTVAPLTGTIPEGMLIYNDGGTEVDGFYHWTGSAWSIMSTADNVATTNVQTANLNLTTTYLSTSITASQGQSFIVKITYDDGDMQVFNLNIGINAAIVFYLNSGPTGNSETMTITCTGQNDIELHKHALTGVIELRTVGGTEAITIDFKRIF